jgi:hypothetical protein
MKSLNSDAFFNICIRLDMATLFELSLMDGNPIYDYIKQPIYWIEKIKLLPYIIEYTPDNLNLDDLKDTYHILEKATKKRDPLYYVVKKENEYAVKILLNSGYDPSMYNINVGNLKTAFYIAHKKLHYQKTTNNQNIFQMLKYHPRTDLFISPDIVNGPLNPFLKNLTNDSLGGLIAGYYYSIPVGDHLYYPLRYDEYMTEIDYFLYVFLLFIIHTRLPIKYRIDKLKEMSVAHKLEHIVDKALDNISPFQEMYTPEVMHLYFVVSGFNLCNNSDYTFHQIINICRHRKYSNDSIAMIGKLVGCHIGLNKLKSNGLIINEDVLNHINKMISHPLDYLINQDIVNHII